MQVLTATLRASTWVRSRSKLARKEVLSCRLSFHEYPNSSVGFALAKAEACLFQVIEIAQRQAMRWALRATVSPAHLWHQHGNGAAGPKH